MTADSESEEYLDDLSSQVQELKSIYKQMYLDPAQTMLQKKQLDQTLSQINEFSINAFYSIQKDPHLSLEEKKQLYSEIKSLHQEVQTASEDYMKNLRSGMERRGEQTLLVSDRHRDTQVYSLILVKEMNQDLQELEITLSQLFQVFVGFAALVDAQGEHVNKIEENVENAQVYVEEGVKELTEAREIKIEERKKCCCLATCGLSVLALGTLGVGSSIVGRCCSIQ